MGIESALLAMGASAGTATAVSTGLSVLSGVSSIIGGFQSNQEAKYQSSLATQEAKMRGAEAERVAAKEAGYANDEANDVRRRQKLAYMKSGVSLEGTPFLALEETRRRGKENVDEILRGGAASSAAAYSEGRIRAAQLKSSGRQAFMSGLTNAGQSFGRLV